MFHFVNGLDVAVLQKILIFVTCKAVHNAFQRIWKQIPQVLCYVFLKVGNVFFREIKVLKLPLLLVEFHRFSDWSMTECTLYVLAKAQKLYHALCNFI